MQPKKIGLFVLLVAVLGVVIVVQIRRAAHPTKPPPDAPGYYTGVMLNKSGTAYTTEEGKIVPPPPGARPVKAAGGQPGSTAK
jgi:hypothetical protein